MKETDILVKARAFARLEYAKNDPKHQWAHVEAVMNRAMEIARQLPNVDFELLQLGVIFHDIDYHSESTYAQNYAAHVENSIRVAETFLKRHDYPPQRIAKLKKILLDHSTPHRKKFGESQRLEGKILYDADKSIFITTLQRYHTYFPLLYLTQTKQLVQKPAE